MALSLDKGDSISLTKVAEDAGNSLSQVTVGLGWKANAKFLGSSYDLDASVFVLDSSGRVLGSSWFVWYGNKKSPGGVVTHSGDNLVGGSGKKDDEQIVIDLSRLPSEAARVRVVVNIYNAQSKRQSFGKVKDAYMRIIDDRGAEMAHYRLAENFDKETAVTFGELNKTGREWSFAAIGQGHVASLDDLARPYGARA